MSAPKSEGTASQSLFRTQKWLAYRTAGLPPWGNYRGLHCKAESTRKGVGWRKNHSSFISSLLCPTERDSTTRLSQVWEGPPLCFWKLWKAFSHPYTTRSSHTEKHTKEWGLVFNSVQSARGPCPGAIQPLYKQRSLGWKAFIYLDDLVSAFTITLSPEAVFQTIAIKNWRTSICP